MARHVRVLHLCDMHADEETEATTTRNITIDGTETQLDLCDTDAQRFDEAINAWISAGTRVGQTTTRGRIKRGKRGHDPKAVREWARQNHVTVPDRGRVPDSVVEQYNAAH